MNGIELQDREFVAAIRDGREPNSSVAQVLPCYEVLDHLEQQLHGVSDQTSHNQAQSTPDHEEDHG